MGLAVAFRTARQDSNLDFRCVVAGPPFTASRAQTSDIRQRREALVNELISDLTVYPYTKETALLAGKLDGKRQSRGVVIPLILKGLSFLGFGVLAKYLYF